MHKYGKKPPKFHPKTLLMHDFVDAALPPPEAKRAWEYSISDATWAQSMLGNDQTGNCVEAMILHFIMAAEASAGNPVPQFTTEDGIALYSAITGYNPADPSTDQGTVITDALAYMVSTGYKGYKFLGWAAFDYTNPMRVNQAIDIFGTALLGIGVMQSMEDQFNQGLPWNAPFTGELLGGHGVPFLGYGRLGRTLITWAARQQTDLNFPSVIDEAYVPITPAFLTKALTTPILGLNVDALNAALAAIKS